VKVALLGAGLMGAQIGCEYALGGHDVTVVARDLDRLDGRVDEALGTVAALGLRTDTEVAAARGRLRSTTTIGEDAYDLVVESLPEDLELKAKLLREAAALSPAAVLVSNTSSLGIGVLGDAVGAPERTMGTHYFNPPLLSPLVETTPGPRTASKVVQFVLDILVALGKHPVLVERDVPGFVWNRLQLALLRECVWLVEQGIAQPGTVDEIVREGLARRWRHVGPFEAIALGGADTWERVSANLVPSLSTAEVLRDVRRFGNAHAAQLAELRARRDRGLADELLRDAASEGA
jgi:3-hydroxybutyryl-CoA dehydrogenase